MSGSLTKTDASAGGRRQLPAAGEIFLDHVAHFVPDMMAAHRELNRLGFVQTPYTSHRHAVEGVPEPVPSGTANRCVMLPEGYVEIITVEDATTPLGERTARQTARYTGLHLLAFSTADVEAIQGRLTFSGFKPQPLVHLKRPVPLPNGSDAVAEFTVCRVREEDMPEGRVQYLSHASEEVVWQDRWMAHGNGIVGLRDAVICVETPDAVAARYCWFLDQGTAKPAGTDRYRVAVGRGGVVICGREGLSALLPGLNPPSLPFMAGYGALCRSLDDTAAFLRDRGFDPAPLGDGCLRLDLPPALGGTLILAEDEAAFPWSAPPREGTTDT